MSNFGSGESLGATIPFMARETVRRLATVSQMFGSFIIAVYVFFVLITPIPSISELFTSFLGFPHMICS